MKKAAALLSLVFVLLLAGCQWGPQVLSPTRDGIVIGDTARLIVQSYSVEEDRVFLNDVEVFPEWQAEAYADRWMADISLQYRGEHTLTLGKVWGGESSVSFRNDLHGSVDVAENVLAHILRQNNPEDLDWNWVAAIFLYPLAKISELSDQGETYLDYVRRFHEHYMDQGTPSIDLADACPAALSAYYLAREHGEAFAMPNVEKVVHYIKTGERNAIGSLDHLGFGFESLFYPGSIWVDSLMMWVLISVQVGLDTGDAELLDFALPQPSIFASRLRDPDTGLFFHAWNVEEDHLLPAFNTPWLRGNGWVLTAVLEMISELGPDHPRYGEYAALFTDLAEATVPYRQPSGYWDTVITMPGYAYEEASGSALIAYAYAKGARLGLLDPSYRELGRDTFRAIVSRMKKQETGYSVEEISVGTNPMGAPGYRAVPRTSERLYGYGAFLFLAMELAGDDF